LADHSRVTVLDFACGTGTFIVEILEQVFQSLGPDSGMLDLVVREHILKNVFGFEYLIAPYTIAHLKLSQYLKDRNYQLADTERFLVYLTNTLEPVDPQPNLLLPALTAESREAQGIKDKDILVIVGNPPYAGHSKNPSERVVEETVREQRRGNKVIKLKRPRRVKRTIKTAIGRLIEDYKVVDGRPLGEQNSKWLQDDYVKFIRFAQEKMEQVEEGVVGIITNHSYLDNPTFRGMRQSLTKAFNQIYIVDLHGSTKPKETAPENVANENVFDIQKGVAIALFVKKPGAHKGIWYSEFWGTRLEKYKQAFNEQLRTIECREVECFTPYYMFKPLDWSEWPTYASGWAIADSLNPTREKQEIFGLSVLGFQTHRDHYAIAAQYSDIEARGQDMIDSALSDEDLARKYQLKDNRDWKIRSARTALRDNKDWKSNIIKCAYRPFDSRYCYFGNEFMDYPRRELLDHVACRDNVELLVPRQIGGATWQHALASEIVTESCYISDGSTEQNYVFPLYLYPLETRRRMRRADLFAEIDFGGAERIENLTPGFRNWLDDRYGCHFSPEEVLGFIYAELNASTYRRQYAEFLRIDFPRILFPAMRADFETMAALGWELLQKHLLRGLSPSKYAEYHGKGDHSVAKPHYVEAEQAIYINELQYFAPVPLEIWSFSIGGYQVMDKYLGARISLKLTLDEIKNLTAIANVLAFTIMQMNKIDAAYRTAFFCY
jgi:predicted helicase